MCIRDREKALETMKYYNVVPEAWAPLGGGRYNPVSYTHLDVYKRQSLYNTGKMLEHHDGTLTEEPVQEVKEEDVYKRQEIDGHTTFTLGYTLDSVYWSKGYASEALKSVFKAMHETRCV